MSDAELKERLVRIEVLLQGLPCKEHHADLKALKSNSQYQKGWRNGALWGIGAISALGTGGIMTLLMKVLP